MLRAEGKNISGLTLANYLQRYSEMGQNYVKSLKTIIRANELSPFDQGTLGQIDAEFSLSLNDF